MTTDSLIAQALATVAEEEHEPTPHEYLAAGWQPLPLESGTKYPPPSGFTGWSGARVTSVEVAHWTVTGQYGNVALRMPPGVIGVDVDHYGAKLGGDHLAAVEAELGALPATWSSTSRGEGQPSGIRFYRVPPNVVLPGELPDADVEFVQAHHRYAVVAPSVVEGRRYRWYDDAGEAADRVPGIDDLAELPYRWWKQFQEVRTGKRGEVATTEQARDFLAAHDQTGDPKKLNGVRAMLERGSVVGSRHATLVKVACMAMREARAGLYPAEEAVGVLSEWWGRVIAGDPRRLDGTEFSNALLWAIGEALATPADEIEDRRTRAEEEQRRYEESTNLRGLIVEPERSATGTPETGERIEAPHTWRWVGDLCRDVDAAPAPSYLVHPLIVAGDYGVFGAEKKAGKSWLAFDLAVNVAAGGRFLGTYEVHTPGPVLLYAGEGGKRKLVRRLRAVAEFYGYRLEDLRIAVEERAPKLNVAEGIAKIEAALSATGAVLTIIDPAYLALTGAKTSDLVAMGALLETVQHVCQSAGSTLLMTHHWNKTGVGTGADRFTGSGFAEWGRFLMSGEVKSKNKDTRTEGSVVLLRVELVGDETPDTEILIRRHVWEVERGHLGSAMGYEITIVDGALDELPDDADPRLKDMRPATRKVLEVLALQPGEWLSCKEIGDVAAKKWGPLKARTIQDSAKTLVECGLAEVMTVGNFSAHAWRTKVDRNVF